MVSDNKPEVRFCRMTAPSVPYMDVVMIHEPAVPSMSSSQMPRRQHGYRSCCGSRARRIRRYAVTACHFTCVLVSRAYRPCSSNVTVCWCFITPPRLWTRNAYLGTILQRYYCTNCKYLGARTAVAVLVKRAPISSHMKYGRWTLVLCNSIRYISSALVRHA